MGERLPDETTSTRYEATTPAYWRGVGRRRMLTVIGAVALGIALLALFVPWSLAARDAARTAGETTQTIAPTEDTSATTSGVAPTGTPIETATPGATGSGAIPGEATPGGATGATGGQVASGRAARVAYRRDGWLCVADEDGSDERRVVASAAGVFSLSPDGATLAYVADVSGAVLSLADVATGRIVTAGAAQQDRPSWSRDSAWLAYTAPGPEVRRVKRDGSGVKALFAGSLPAVASAAEIVVGAAPQGGPSAIVVWMPGKSVRLAADGPVSGLACDGGRVYYGTGVSSEGGASLRAVNLGGTNRKVLVAPPAATRAVSLCDLALAPGAATISYSECGDDGYSRVFVLPVGGGTPTALSTRRDCYLLGWNATGSGLLFIEGNAFQGEPTALIGVRPDGTSRTRVIEGAGR